MSGIENDSEQERREVVRQPMSISDRAHFDRKLKALEENLANGSERLQDPGVKAMYSASQKASSGRERLEREAAGRPTIREPAVKRPRGRPRKLPDDPMGKLRLRPPSEADKASV